MAAIDGAGGGVISKPTEGDLRKSPSQQGRDARPSAPVGTTAVTTTNSSWSGIEGTWLRDPGEDLGLQMGHPFTAALLHMIPEFPALLEKSMGVPVSKQRVVFDFGPYHRVMNTT